MRIIELVHTPYSRVLCRDILSVSRALRDRYWYSPISQVGKGRLRDPGWLAQGQPASKGRSRDSNPGLHDSNYAFNHYSPLPVSGVGSWSYISLKPPDPGDWRA